MKTNLDKIFKTDENAEKEGVMFKVSDTIGFKLLPFKGTNPRVKAAVAKHLKPYSRQIEMGTVDQDKLLEINIKIFLDVCLVDWEGVEIDGKLTPYNKEVALPFFKNLPELFDTLWRHAQDFNNYREDLGNS